tara:strand:- start:203 stop:511 length:309 start_codon:yes stop_codon:yes gene_type:complete
MENKTVKIICGDYPENFEKLEILSDANFVFENDPEYNTVQLFDKNENTVYVNSFVECEHYVVGGWDQNSTIILEAELIQTTTIVFFVAIIFKYIYKRITRDF